MGVSGFRNRQTVYRMLPCTVILCKPDSMTMQAR